MAPKKGTTPRKTKKPETEESDSESEREEEFVPRPDPDASKMSEGHQLRMAMTKHRQDNQLDINRKFRQLHRDYIAGLPESEAPRLKMFKFTAENMTRQHMREEYKTPRTGRQHREQREFQLEMAKDNFGLPSHNITSEMGIHYDYCHEHGLLPDDLLGEGSGLQPPIRAEAARQRAIAHAAVRQRQSFTPSLPSTPEPTIPITTRSGRSVRKVSRPCAQDEVTPKQRSVRQVKPKADKTPVIQESVVLVEKLQVVQAEEPQVEPSVAQD